MSIRFHPNYRAAATDREYPAALRAILSLEALSAARSEISTWPGYAPTPLRDLNGLAAASGIAALRYKDEAGRFGLGSFKALGGALAVLRLVQREMVAVRGTDAGCADRDARDLAACRHREQAAGLTVTCATDGNHGRAVAWGARTFGCHCVVYLHERVSMEREQAIAALGAEVRRMRGTYDDAVRYADAAAKRNGWHVVSDTSYPGYEEVPREVMQGYGVLVAEALEQWSGPLPTHAFVQGGVGGLAASVGATLWEQLGAARPRLIVVEPERADCLFQSAVQGKPAVVTGDLDTVMAGLACGEVSALAWRVLEQCAHGFMTLPDTAAIETMRRLAQGTGGDVPVVGGESGVAGLAGLLAVCAEPAVRQLVELNADSRVLVIGSEGATDPAQYTKLVGRTPDQVASQAGR